MKKLFLLLILLPLNAYADQCDTGLQRCYVYAPDRQGECFSLYTQCKNENSISSELREMNQRQRLQDDDSLMASQERIRERYRRR